MSQSGDKTEKATPKKRRDARERGQVLKSTEVTTAFCSIVMFGFMLAFWPGMASRLLKLMRDYLDPAFLSSASYQMTVKSVGELSVQAILSFAAVILPVLGVAVLAGLIANVVQVGFLFTSKTLAPKLERINPLKGFKRIFSIRTLTELLKSILKILVLGYILYGEYKKLLTKFPTLLGTDVYAAFIEILTTAFSVALKMAAAFVVIAAFDFVVAWRKHEKDLMMTKQEVKDEYKLMEGDPQIKGKIKQKQLQMSAMRMMAQVPTADVVITNPTHFAVALRYDEGGSGAPVVVAKGQGFVALKIKEAARAHGIEAVENRPLARALFDLCDLGTEIPEEFYQAVADILVYVYKLKNRRPGEGK